MLSLEELRNEVETGARRHRRGGVHRHAGSADGQAAGCGTLPRRSPSTTGSRAATTCSRSTWRWNRSPGYEIASWEPGYGDFHLHARPVHAATDPVARGHGARPVRRRRARRLADRRFAAAGPAAAGRTGARARLRADVRLRARVLLADGVVRRGARKGYRDLTPSVPYVPDYHLLATTYDEPLIRQIRRGMRGAGLAVETLEGRGVARPARDQLPLRRRAHDRRQPRRLQERREGDRAPERVLDHVHGEARPRRGSGTRATSTASCGATGRMRSATSRRFSRSSSRVDRVRAGARAVPRAERQLVQALRRRPWAPTTLAWGNDNRTCGFRVVGHGGLASGGDADSRWRCQSVSGVRGAYRGRAARDDRGARAPARRSRATRTSRTRRAVSVDAARGGRRARGAGRRRASAFGDDVVEHYLNYARVEQRLFDSVVTDWERERLFERG